MSTIHTDHGDGHGDGRDDGREARRELFDTVLRQFWVHSSHDDFSFLLLQYLHLCFIKFINLKSPARAALGAASPLEQH